MAVSTTPITHVECRSSGACTQKKDKRMTPNGGRHLVFYTIVGGTVLAWFFAAVLMPVVSLHNWAQIQNVWDRWQAVNMGMLALSASVIAFAAAQYREHRTIQRRMDAARAFLPEQLSELTEYCRLGMRTLEVAWHRVSDENDDLSTPLRPAPPPLPQTYREVFKENLQYAPAPVVRHLTQILGELQVHESRIRSLESAFRPPHNPIPIPIVVKDYLTNLAIINARVDRLYAYGRPSGIFDDSPFTSAEVISKLRLGGVLVSEIDGLAKFIEPAIARANEGVPYPPSSPASSNA